MNLTDVIAVIILGAAVIAAIWYAKTHRDCSGNCASCHTSCAKRNPGDVPDFVRRYRKDHPKQESRKEKGRENHEG